MPCRHIVTDCFNLKGVGYFFVTTVYLPTGFALLFVPPDLTTGLAVLAGLPRFFFVTTFMEKTDTLDKKETHQKN